MNEQIEKGNKTNINIVNDLTQGTKLNEQSKNKIIVDRKKQFCAKLNLNFKERKITENGWLRIIINIKVIDIESKNFRKDKSLQKAKKESERHSSYISEP